MYAFWLLVQSPRAPKGPRQLNLLVFPVEFLSPNGPQFFPQLFQETPELHLMFGVCFGICFSQLLGGASQRTVKLSSCLQTYQSIIVSGIGACLWGGTHVGPVIGWPFPQSIS